MKPWETLDTATLPDGTELYLRRHDDEYVLWLDGYDLMSSRQHGSEEALAELTCGLADEDEVVLVGGLGLGYTLRAALDRVGPRGTVIVAELVPKVLEWNQGVLGPLAGNPLQDRRSQVDLRDVREVIARGRASFDAILLDVDNGPNAFSQPANKSLYGGAGLAQIKRALRPSGRLGVWSSTPERPFLNRLQRAGFDAEEHRVRARGGERRGPWHWLYIGTMG